jgi:ribonuclease HI
VPRHCGVGVSLFLDQPHIFFPKFATHPGTNNNTKIYALWLLLKSAVDKGLTKLQALEDSKLMVDCDNKIM